MVLSGSRFTPSSALVIFWDIGLRNCLVTCSFVTEDAQGGTQGYEPFQQGEMPTVPTPENPTPENPTPASDAYATQAVDPHLSHSGDLYAAHQSEPYPAQPPGDYSGLPSGAYPIQPSPIQPSPVAFPASGVPAANFPISGLPASVSGGPIPVSGAGIPAGPYDFGSPSAFGGRRIEPSVRPERNRLVIGLLVGLAVGLVLFGGGGFFAGHATRTAHAPASAPTSASAAPSPSSSLAVFEQSQLTLNQPHFANSGLVSIAAGWLPYLSNCGRSGEPGGPALNAGEKTRVRCTLDGMSAIFVEYASVAARDKARVQTLGQNVDARALTPGVGVAAQRPAPSARTTGNYVEYAYRLTEGRVARTVAGLWWDDTQTPVAGYLLAYWKESIGETWEPMRDLWSRYA